MHQSSLMLLARPTEVSAGLRGILREAGLDLRLGDRLFDSANYHQSFSEWHRGTTEELQRLLEVGSRIMAPAFDFVLDRIVSRNGDRIDWRFEGLAGRTPEFVTVIDAIRAAFECVDGISDPVSHAPHITCAYGAPEHIKAIDFPAITWRVDRIELVRRMRDPYRYDTIASWDLLPSSHRAATQAMLF